MPRYWARTTLGFFAAIGLPGLAGFVAEFLVFLGAWVSAHPWWLFPGVIGALILGVSSMALFALDVWGATLAGIAGAALVRGSSEAMVTALTGDLASAGQRGRAVGLVHTASDLGSASAPEIASSPNPPCSESSPSPPKMMSSACRPYVCIR